MRSFALAMLLSSCASAGVLEHTAIAALHYLRIQPHAAEWEYSGIIVYRAGTYQYSGFPHTEKFRDHVQTDVKGQMQPGDRLVAIYHNHPCYSTTLWTQYFSPADLIAAKFWSVPTFMLDVCTGDVHEFDWTIDTIKASGADVKAITRAGAKVIVHLPSGRIVGNIGITSPNLDLSGIGEFMGFDPRELR